VSGESSTALSRNNATVELSLASLPSPAPVAFLPEIDLKGPDQQFVEFETFANRDEAELLAEFRWNSKIQRLAVIL
jgi:hypothetical protein